MLKDFQAGDKIRHIVLIKVQKVGSTSTGGVFARGVVQDNSASINFICFDAGMVERMRKLEGFVAMQVIGQIDINKFAQDSSFENTKSETRIETETTHTDPTKHRTDRLPDELFGQASAKGVQQVGFGKDDIGGKAAKMPHQTDIHKNILEKTLIKAGTQRQTLR